MKKVLPFLVLLGTAGCGNQDPLYQGHPLDAWLKDINHHEKAVRDQAIEVVVSIQGDKRVVPRLIAMLKDGSFGAAETMGKMAPIGTEGNSEEAKQMVTALAEALQTRNLSVRFAAARALSRFGAAAKPAVPSLVQMLKDSDAEVRVQAAEALGNLQEHAIEAEDPLHQAAQTDPAVLVQRTAADALRKINPDKWGKSSKAP